MALDWLEQAKQAKAALKDKDDRIRRQDLDLSKYRSIGVSDTLVDVLLGDARRASPSGSQVGRETR